MDARPAATGTLANWLRRGWPQRLASAPEFDPLTGLASRAGLERCLPEIASGLPPGTPMALLVLDLYRFSQVNQYWGRQAGDRVLLELARRLGGLDGFRVAARVGADSLALLLCGEAAAAWRGYVERMLKALREPFAVAPGHARKLSASVGCALYPQDAGHASRLLGLAEAAVFSQAERELSRRSERLDAYGAEAADNMAWLQRFLKPHLARLNRQFLGRLGLHERPAGRHDRGLPARAAVALLPALQGHVQLLLAPALQRELHREHATRLGRLLAALGLPAQVGMQAMSGLHRDLAGLVQRIPARLSERALFLGALLQRIEADLSYQQQGAEALHRELLHKVREVALAMQATRRRAELLDAAVRCLQGMPFVACCACYIQDAEGRFVVEAQSPAHAAWLDECAQGLAGDCEPAGDSSVELCWIAARLELAPDIARAARRGRRWALALLVRGIRSAAAVPVLDGAGRVLGVLKIYGRLPGQFATDFMRHALDSLRFLVAAELTRVGGGLALPAVAADERALWRQRLFGGGLRMLMQPIVDLRQGRCTRVEALARLQLDSTDLLTPARFLPVLSQQELDRLFVDGLRLALQSLRAWERQGLRLELALNLPASTLRSTDCVAWVRDALARHQVDPRRLSLEILEDREVASHSAMRQATEQLRGLGVGLALDDLGAGYSSLLRLNTLPVDMVKVDQGLVHGIVANNPRAVPLVGGLVELARRLDLRITVEGLETHILLEYAQYLRADYGQGHAICRPLAAQDIPAWLQGWRLPALSGIAPFASRPAERAGLARL